MLRMPFVAEKRKSDKNSPAKYLFQAAYKLVNRGEQPEAAAIKKAAANVGIELEPARLAKLIRAARKDPIHAFENKGLFITQPKPDMGETATLSRIDFTPGRKKKSDPNQAISPQPRKATRIALTGLTEMQNFALLVDAGLRDAPDTLYGTTNRNMARAAERIGFSAQKVGINSYTVEAPFQVVHDAVFSPKTMEFGAMLTHRLANMHRK